MVCLFSRHIIVWALQRSYFSAAEQVNNRIDIVTNRGLNVLNIAEKVRFITVEFLMLARVVLALRLIRLSASIIRVARA